MTDQKSGTEATANTNQSAGGDVGQQASRPTQISARGFGQIAKRLVTRIGETQLSLIAAGIAFFGLLAIFPAMSALVAVSGLLLTPETVSTQLAPMIAALPPAAGEILSGQLEELTATSTEKLSWALILALALALFSASRGTLNLIVGLNVIYEEAETRGFVRVQLTGLLMTLAAILGLIVALAMVAAFPVLAATLGAADTVTQVILLLRWPLLLIAAIVGFGLLYRHSPARRPANWSWVSPGAVTGVLIWLAATGGFSWYVQTFGNYSETFGALAGVIILMMWLYLTSFAILFGALIDAELEAQTRRDTTIGPPRPMGQRGAVKADRSEAVET